MASGRHLSSEWMFQNSLVESKKKVMGMRLRIFCSELELIPTDIIPMIRIEWDSSFGDIEGNKEAIASTGWNLLTCCLLLHPMLRRTMSSHDIQTECENNLVINRKLELLLDKVEENDSFDEEDDVLNFNYGYAGVMIDKIVGQSDIERARRARRARNNHPKC